MATKEHEIWDSRIKRAKKRRDEWATMFRVDLARAYYLGQQKPEGFADEDWITVNKLYSHLEAQLPALYSVDPYFYVKLKKSYQADREALAAMEATGQIRQGMLNYLKVELDLKKKARLAISQAHFSYGVMKTRYAAENRENEKAGQPITDDNGAEILDDQGEPLKHPDTMPVNQRYALDWVSSDDMLWDEDAGPLEDSWSFLAQKVRTDKDEALRNPRYDRKVVERIQPRPPEKGKGFLEKIFQKVTTNDAGKANERFVTFWEVYDLKNRKWLTVADDATDLVSKPDSLPDGVEGHPYSFLRFRLLEDSPYPYPPMSPGIDPQKEIGLLRSRMVSHRKRFNRKYEVVRSMLESDDQASALETGDDGALVFVKSVGAIGPIKDAPLDQQTTFVELNMLSNELTELLGSPGQARGIADADSATEAGILDARQEVKEGDRMEAVKDFTIDTARKLDALVQTHIDRDEAVRITGPQGEMWVNVRQEDYKEIEGEYEYSVNVGASRPRLPDIERAQWMAFLSQVVIPFPHILTLPAVMKRVAAMFHIEDDAALEEFRVMGEKILNQQVPPPGNTGGSQPAENNPAASTMGSALGALTGVQGDGGQG